MSDIAKTDTGLVDIEIDGFPLKAPKGSMIIEAADKAGIDIPRFCYHKNLTIAANCRMCLVDVEKAPKPLPACATPVMNGMRVLTGSRRAVDAQHGVMEFLLINHPLDCPICDQGGECELQDLAMGYGRSVSRFTERKRVVKDKNIGPLIQTDMTRCIHCTRCVRFLEEIAGTSELGGIGRGENLEIGTFIEQSIESELSGNIIDLCPVGALTNKPYRYSARAWELMALPSVAAHDGVGSNIFYHSRRGRILRAVPMENEAVNQTWISDRDRYSHFGLYSDDRVLEPRVKLDGSWQTVSWDEALEHAAQGISAIVENHGAEQFGALMSPSSFSEEFFLAQKMVRSIGSGNIDHRLRHTDFSDDPISGAEPVFGESIADLAAADAILLVGSNIRHEAPILGHKVRQANLNGASISAINPLACNFNFELEHSLVAAPQNLLTELAGVAHAIQSETGAAVPAAIEDLLGQNQASTGATAIARRLVKADNAVIISGEITAAHPNAALLRALNRFIAAASGAQLNQLSFGANASGAWLAAAVPFAGETAIQGSNTRQMLEQALKCYFLWDFEPEFDTANPQLASSAIGAADFVVAVASFATSSLEQLADVILPLAPAAESEGTLTNLDRRSQVLSPAGRISGQAKAGWKILRRLANALVLDGFDYINLEQVQVALEENSNAHGTAGDTDVELHMPAKDGDGMYRIGDLPMYSGDPLVRRSTPLQESPHAHNQFVGLNPEDASRLGLQNEQQVRVSQGSGEARLPVRILDTIPIGGAWVRSGTCANRHLGDAFGPLTVEAE